MNSCFNCAAMITSICAVLMLNGCATTITSNNISFPVKTVPEGASVSAFSKGLHQTVRCGKSPCTMNLRQTHDYMVTIKKNGYETQHIKVKSENSVEGDSGSLVGNAIAGGAIGLFVDAGSGADDRLFPGSLNLKLKPSMPNMDAKEEQSK